MTRREWAEEALRRIKDLPPAGEIGQERFLEEWFLCVGRLVEEAQAHALTGHDDVPKDGHHMVHVWRALTAQEIRALQEVPGYAQGIANLMLPIIQIAIYDIAKHYQEVGFERQEGEEASAPGQAGGDAERQGDPLSPATGPAPEVVPPPEEAPDPDALLTGMKLYGVRKLGDDLDIPYRSLHGMARGRNLKPPKDLEVVATALGTLPTASLASLGWSKQTIVEDVTRAWWDAHRVKSAPATSA